jgi:methylenetetrahydrofolate reductase (NADPH)
VRIADLYSQGRPVFSFEFFPPHSDAGVTALMRTLDLLRPLEPDFVSVTYPLDRARRHLTLELVSRIQRETGIEAMAHLTCVDATRDEIREVLERLRAERIDNVLALRGDPPPEEQITVPPDSWFPHASELVTFIRSEFRFCVGGAAHPEKHPEATDLSTDLEHLRWKVRTGCEFLITQLFFDNESYFQFVERAHATGVEVPIVPGIMPVTSVAGVKRMTQVSGASIPEDLLCQLEHAQDDRDAVAELGVAWARAQCEDLLERGAPGIHFYTLNRSKATRRILSSLRGL